MLSARFQMQSVKEIESDAKMVNVGPIADLSALGAGLQLPLKAIKRPNAQIKMMPLRYVPFF